MVKLWTVGRTDGRTNIGVVWLKTDKNQPWGRRTDGRTRRIRHIMCYMVKLWGRRTDGRTNIGVFWLKSWTLLDIFVVDFFFLDIEIVGLSDIGHKKLDIFVVTPLSTHLGVKKCT